MGALVLNYGRARRDWGPWWFGPSWVSLALLAALAVAVGYLRQHPAPWEIEREHAFTHDEISATWPRILCGRNIVFGLYTPGGQSVFPILSEKAQVWDWTSGRLVRELSLRAPDELTSERYGFRGSDGSVWVARVRGEVLEIEDVCTGRARQMRWPEDTWPLLGMQIVQRNDGSVLVAGWFTSSASRVSLMEVWQLGPGATAAPRNLLTLPNDETKPTGDAGFPDDGDCVSWSLNHDVFVCNVQNRWAGREVAWLLETRRKLYDDESRNFDIGPMADHAFVTACDSKVVCLRGREGELLRTITIPPHKQGNSVVAPTMDRLVVWRAVVAGGSAITDASIWDLVTGRLLCSRFLPIDAQSGHFEFFSGDGRRMIWKPNGSAAACIIDADMLRVIATLPPDLDIHEVSQDGTRILASPRRAPSGNREYVVVLNRAGRESFLGIFGMPQCWVVAGLMAILVACLARDARRDSEWEAGAVSMLAVGVLLILGWAGTLAVVVDGCLGKFDRNLSPLPLLAGLAILRGGRGWRLISAGCLLAAAVWAGWHVHLLGPGAFRHVGDGRFIWLFDRHRWLPTARIAMGYAALAAVSLPAGVRLAWDGWKG